MNKLSWGAIKRAVYERANGCCEYCQTSEANSGQTLHVDHINPAEGDKLDDFCLACWNCNTSKLEATFLAKKAGQSILNGLTAACVSEG
jgi:5-methylcytosine-specific restriction endonuclease McrA